VARLRSRRERGFGFVEAAAAIVVVAVGLLAHAALTTIGQAHQGQIEEARIAVQAARAKIEELRSGEFGLLFVAHDASTANDPPAAPGPHFDVPGLSPSPSDPDGRVGRIRFPVDPDDVIPSLREDLELPALGLPYDLDGDGLIDPLPKDTSYVHLPVLIEIRWRGRNGDRLLRLPTWLTELR